MNEAATTIAQYRYATEPGVAILFGLVGSLLAIGIGALCVGRLVRSLPSSAVVGICSAVGFGVVGTVTFLVGLAGGLSPLFFYVGATIWLIAGAIGIKLRWADLRPSGVRDSTSRILIMVIVVLILTRVPAVFTPSAGADWDTTSHQLAMSKIWLDRGSVEYLPWMNHSNIPATSNMLYIWGLKFGGQAGAKMFGLCFAICALLGLSGLVGHKFGSRAAGWAALALAATPVLLWEIGTAYQDVIHGFFAGTAILFAAWWSTDFERRWAVLSGVFLGLALATKYTGFQFAVATVLSLLVIGAVRRQFKQVARGVALVSVIAIAIAAPWYLRNVANTGNPVYPFFYNVFGGRDWSPQNAAAYAAEQKRFGIGQLDDGKNAAALPGSITALATMPHVHINNGAPWGAFGPALLLAAFLALFSGRTRRDEAVLITAALLTLGTWFFLTQQSRYIVGLAFPLAYLLGSGIHGLRTRWLLGTAVGLQAAWSIYMFAGVHALEIVGRLPYPLSALYVKGSYSSLDESIRYLRADADERAYLSGQEDFGYGEVRRFPFWEGTDYLNSISSHRQDTNVALFDEVRGFYLDCDYYWANPGFSTIIPWNSIESPRQLVDALRKLRTTHVYINLDPTLIGVEQSTQLRRVFAPGYFSEDPGTSSVEPYRMLLVQAFRDGLLRPVNVFDAPLRSDNTAAPPMGILLEVPPTQASG